MSKLRPETVTSTGTAMPYDTALFLIRESVAKRRELIYGRLDDGLGDDEPDTSDVEVETEAKELEESLAAF